ncbi:T9SS type A sorting domain-containing protein [Prevotella sp. HCN-7019]|uniref:T9SS type A sorting domain-containing protein n=1 Tax=Prevotella sp. HCN-7019 TaxID=3134668 RepID=UPI0030BFBBB5
MNKKHIISIFAAIISHAAIYAQAYDQLWITGSAVPGGLQQLEKFPDNQFRFAGKLVDGEVKIINTEGVNDNTIYLTPRYVDSNIVSNGLAYTTSTDASDPGWVVLFDDDRYKFTVNTSTRKVSGELFSPWLELYIAGGCVECGWEAGEAPAFVQDENDPYTWTWVGELKNRPENVEPKRFKILGQNDWGPKSLHPYTQDEDVTTSSQLMINCPDDYKWAIDKDGYYKVTVNIFLQSFNCEYLGTEEPTGITSTDNNASAPVITLQGNDIIVKGNEHLTVDVFNTSGLHITRQTGTDVTIKISEKGIYIVKATDKNGNTVRKVII